MALDNPKKYKIETGSNAKIVQSSPIGVITNNRAF
jgi:hypothetical protein